MKDKYILIVSAVFPPEPVVSGRLSIDLYRELKERGYNARILHPRPTRPYGFVPNPKDIGQLEDEITTDSYVCPESSLLGRIRESWSFGKACVKFIGGHKDKICYVYANTWPMFSQKAIVKAAKKYSLPCAIHVQDVYPEALTNKMKNILGKIVKYLLLPMDKYILGKCTTVVAISEKMKNYLSETRGIEKGKIEVVFNWQDESDFIRYKALESEHPFTFMYMGNIGPVAGVDLLIDAFTKAKCMNARLVVAGSGSMKEYLMQRAKSNLRIEFWDVPNGKVPEIQSEADVMMLPIKKGAASSSIPSKLPAYMFSAKPIIGCMDADCDTAEAIREADCGWVIEPENVELLSALMTTVATCNKEALVMKGEKARQYGLSHFSKEINLNKLTDTILKALES